ncbi:type I-E CRISPR-associated protein Cas5/CasD [Rheinheimera riviphila]|uniref:Type I-E CRISPR-associated protein Cas5/CasD n=1 Tax=Rheinheimera riviphila TaxID=1834037 RepID=A0A437QMH4_9GAMM|nr:type I-E CRISPR-associated protein Cas5/CasD [Rheinheimera riviphila]RVU35682.1 type I-E CRISPR-associated protein Cas5/CasD [Rheinheimera riviphila]
MQYLVFRLYGPMASWGEAAVGGDRPTALHPTRSAVLGLLSAALGIRRDQQTELTDLFQSVQFAIKEYSSGVLVRDYHTAQVPSSDKKMTHRHRKSELTGPGFKLNTVLSTRDYRSDGLWVVAIWLTGQTNVSLAGLADALLKPRFTLYLGRKSCPLAAPLKPQLVETETLKQALDSEFPCLLNSAEQDRSWLRFSKQHSYYWQGPKDLISAGALVTQSVQLWDEPGDRLKWQFSARTEHQLTVSMES